MTEQEKEKRDNKRKRIIGIALGLIMLLSSIGYAFMSFEDNGSGSSKIKIKGVEFSKTENGVWSFNYGNKDYEVFYNPEQVNNISVITSKSLGNYYNLPLYFGINSIADINNNANYEIARNLQGVMLKSQLACLNENCSSENNYPLKNCNEDNIIIFKESLTNTTKVSENNKCIVIEYTIGQEQRVADAYLFKLIGLN